MDHARPIEADSMYHFFTQQDFPDKPFALRQKSYKVGAGQGVMLQTNEYYHHIFTEGLRTCVAFALINTADQSALLIHFFHLTQISNDLNSIVSSFLAESQPKEGGLICLIAGGRAFYDDSEAMCDKLITFAKNDLLNAIHPVKLRIHAPVVADDEETLSIIIDLKSGDIQMALCDEAIVSEDNQILIEHIEFTNLMDRFGFQKQHNT